jgi:hypothetical protein
MKRKIRNGLVGPVVCLAWLVTGCQTTTPVQKAFARIEVGKLTPGWLKANRLASASDFGYVYLQHEDRGASQVSLESYRVAVSHGRVLAKAYTYRKGWQGGGYSNVEFRYVLEVEVEPQAWRPADRQWQPVRYDQALRTAQVAVREVSPARAYPGHVLPPENFLDLRRLFFEEVEARVYAEALTQGFSAVTVLPDEGRDLQDQARDYRRQLNLIQREISVVREQLVRLNYQVEFAQDPEEKQRLARLRDAVEAKRLRLEQNRNQLDKLMETYAAGQDRLLLAKWATASATAASQARQAVETLKANLPGWMLSHHELLALLPGPRDPSAGVWYDKPWSRLWPRNSMSDVLGRVDWNAFLASKAPREFMTPHGVEVKIQGLSERRCRIELHYRFYEWAGGS